MKRLNERIRFQAGDEDLPRLELDDDALAERAPFLSTVSDLQPFHYPQQFPAAAYAKLQRRTVPARLIASELIGKFLEGSEYRRWVSFHEQSFPNRESALAECRSWSYTPKISVICHDAKFSSGSALSGSLDAQIYSGWELKSAAEESLGDHLLFMPSSASLSPYALYFLAQALQSGVYDLVYWDEDSIDGSGRRTDPIFKPGWSPELLLSSRYIGNAFAIQRAMFEANREADTLHQMLCSAAEKQPSVRHIPRVLQHARRSAPVHLPLAFEQALGPDLAEVGVIICSKTPALLERCLRSLRETTPRLENMTVVAHEEFGPVPLLRSTGSRYGADVLPYTGPFNFAQMCNRAVARNRSRYLLFLNDDVEATEPGWAQILLGALWKPNVGIAGATLRYRSGRLQHAGIAAGIGSDGVGHIGRHAKSSKLWPWLLHRRNVTAVTGACLAIERRLFEHIGHFDTRFPNNYNDVDLCLKCRAAGWEVVCVPTPGLVHDECQTRQGVVSSEERDRLFQKWGEVVSRVDPFYSPALHRSESIRLSFERV